MLLSQFWLATKTQPITTGIVFVIPRDNSVTLQTIYSFTPANNTFLFLKLFREFFHRRFYKNGSEFSQDLF